MENRIFVRKSDQMNVKLTLSIDAHVIEKAKKYAALEKVSVSKLVERYLNTLEADPEELTISPTVQELVGIVPSLEVSEKESYRKYLEEKYS